MNPSPWHPGEITLQKRAGVAERMAVFGNKVIRSFMPDQHREFYNQLPFMLIGAVDGKGWPWASILEGAPGFAQSPMPTILNLNTELSNTDPIHSGLAKGQSVGLLGIELHTRRRNRLNGCVTEHTSNHISITVDQSFGNCPQYIQTRDFSWVHDPLKPYHGQLETLNDLDDDARAMLTQADTFFVASYVDLPDGIRQVDVSHRGGKTGFVKINGNRLSIPDFAGNLHFNTLGNLLLNPKAGLLFIDFKNGDVLQLTGTTEIQLEGFEIDSFQGAERIWHLDVRQVVHRRNLLKLRWRFNEFSPNTLITGSWQEVLARQNAEALRQNWRPFRVTKVENESSTIRSFYLEPADGHAMPLYHAGQHLPVRVIVPNQVQPLLRHYTISTAPSDGVLRISVRRDGVVSRQLHESLHVDSILEVRAPQGEFTIDATIKRPVVLISAGVGITPMVAFLHHLLFEGFRTRGMRQTYFIHVARNHTERAFYGELQLLQKAAGNALVQFHALTQPERAGDFDVAQRLDVSHLKAVLPWDDYDFYLCGPAAFTQQWYDQLREQQVADKRIFAETFGPSSLKRLPDTTSVVADLPEAASQPVKVIFAKSAKEVRWQPTGGSLLELAEQRGLNPDFSCRTGSCGSCRTKILQGAVTYTTPPTVKTAVDEALICCAIPSQDAVLTNLILDI